MQNTIFRIIMAACLLMIVGTASAAVTEFHLTEEDANEYYNGEIDVKITVNDVSKTVELEIIEPSDAKVSMKTVLLNIPADKIINVSDDNPKVDWVIEDDKGQGNAGYGAMLTAVDRDKGDQGTVQYIKIQMKQDWDGVLPKNVNDYSIVLHVTRLPGCPESVWLGYQDNGGNINEIPEFPTIALPIAAILGLAFIFQRRKE
ncbi:MAG: PEF-CTERM sorting domain-containing protein [Methanolobus sp.]|uniref:PEF-CTERM sorting domain-containing protein n=1 Tax=Methanolobus sp. TaxID=1874737 RepID=UPI00272F6801|nr:PEF-CTERM sorting domain-containing protein [Methanolobus sp.]MDP2217547.1 PEF-CTERM sorting domain-containing protein [Methanolobus sp.]